MPQGPNPKSHAESHLIIASYGVLELFRNGVRTVSSVTFVPDDAREHQNGLPGADNRRSWSPNATGSREWRKRGERKI
jgi:hypothetical protein